MAGWPTALADKIDARKPPSLELRDLADRAREIARMQKVGSEPIPPCGRLCTPAEDLEHAVKVGNGVADMIKFSRTAYVESFNHAQTTVCR